VPKCTKTLHFFLEKKSPLPYPDHYPGGEGTPIPRDPTLKVLPSTTFKSWLATPLARSFISAVKAESDGQMQMHCSVASLVQ